jgi:sarcosine oxidase
MNPRLHTLVVGAGCFGAWTALELLRRGARVTLLDAWGPGHSRASSGGATRIIRSTYGSHAIYTRMARRALTRWQEYDARWGADLLRSTGAVWLVPAGSSFADASAAVLAAEGIPFQELTLREAARRYPQMSFDDVARVWFEPEAGYLFASRACAHLTARFVAEGGTYRIAAAVSPAVLDGRGVTLADGSNVHADAYVFACGPWLGELFPDVVADRVTATRQEVYYFGVPPGDGRFVEGQLPVWLECGSRFVYGVPSDDGRGFKIADDTPGPVMNPTTDERVPTLDGVRAARSYLGGRFPALRDAPLVGAEVCQYEATPDSHFIIDRHPYDHRVWIVGGGSGHGFKMGPIVGEMAAAAVLGQALPDPAFSLARFTTVPAGGWAAKWA